MGYRSEIGCLVTCPKHVAGSKIISRFKKAFGEDFDACFDVKQFSNGEDSFVYIHGDWLKWYEDSYSDVMAFMDIVHTWEDHYKTGGVHFVRIGESLGDIEEDYRGDPQQYIEVYSQMSVRTEE